MKTFSNAINRIGTESAFAVGPEIADLISKGYDVVKLNIGEPGCKVPSPAKKAMLESVKKDETHYTLSPGTDSLRSTIAEYMSITRKVNFKKENVVVCPGGKPVIAGTFFILVDPGDEVIYPTPGYPIYESMIQFVGAKGVPIEIREDKGFRFDIEDLKKLVSKKTKLLVLNSPSNPTGGVLEKKDLKEIAALAKKYDFYILSDECYSRIIYGKEFERVAYKGNKIPIAPSITSIPGMAERTVILDAFSKAYAGTGMRVGFACSKNEDFMKKYLTYAINIWSCLPKPIMDGAEACLGRDQSEVRKEFQMYEEKRDMAVEMLNKIKGIHCHNPKAAFYLFPNVTEVCRKLKMNSEELRKYLLSYDKKNKKGVAVLSRIHFGKPLPLEKEEYIRISFGGSKADVKEGIVRIKEAIELAEKRSS